MAGPVVSARFPRAEHLRKRADFVRVQDHPGARVRARSFLVLLAANAQGEPAAARAGFVASRKLGGAVQRNRAKRLLRELFRHHKAVFPPGIDVVFIALSAILDKQLGQLKAELSVISSEIARRARGLAGSALPTQAAPRRTGPPRSASPLPPASPRTGRSWPPSS